MSARVIRGLWPAIRDPSSVGRYELRSELLHNIELSKAVAHILIAT